LLLAYLAADYRSQPQRSPTFPPHSLLKILSPNDDDDDDETATKLVMKRPLEVGSTRALLSNNNIIEKDDFERISEVGDIPVLSSIDQLGALPPAKKARSNEA
jgi:hypothetical protein